jgi:hypothetical protein
MDGPQSQFGHSGKDKKNSCPCQKLNPGSLACSLVTILTELPSPYCTLWKWNLGTYNDSKLALICYKKQYKFTKKWTEYPERIPEEKYKNPFQRSASIFMASRPRRPWLETPLPWKPQNSHKKVTGSWHIPFSVFQRLQCTMVCIKYEVQYQKTTKPLCSFCSALIMNLIHRHGKRPNNIPNFLTCKSLTFAWSSVYTICNWRQLHLCTSYLLSSILSTYQPCKLLKWE